MRGLFRAFDREGVDFLLIGGQAAILYGASHFTQDLDVWICPEDRNRKAFLRELRTLRAAGRLLPQGLAASSLL